MDDQGGSYICTAPLTSITIPELKALHDKIASLKQENQSLAGEVRRQIKKREAAERHLAAAGEVNKRLISKIARLEYWGE